MRTLLYFNLQDVAMARLARERLGKLAGTAALIEGPWFSQGDNQSVGGLPNIDAGQITYREEFAIGGLFVGAIIGGVAVLRYGISVGAGATTMAYIGAITLGAMIAWWIGGLVGARIGRLELGRRRSARATDQLLMIVSCKSTFKEITKQSMRDLGGVSIDEHRDLMPGFRWA